LKRNTVAQPASKKNFATSVAKVEEKKEDDGGDLWS